MVQYRRVIWSRPNGYWKLSPSQSWSLMNLKAALTRARYGHLRSTSKHRLSELYSRAQRGLISYEECGKEALKTFCARRGLQINESKPKKAYLIQLLEKADDDQTFVRFIGLPPELRANIYELYFNSLGQLDGPAQPPITQVSRLVRGESLPLFYKTCAFTITVLKPFGYSNYRKPSLCMLTKAFLDHTSDENLNRIRRIELTGPVEDHGRMEMGSWLLDFKRKAKRPLLRKSLGGKRFLSMATRKRIVKRIAPIRRACINGSQPARDLIPRFVEVFEGEHGAR